jgi:hypothetical protein
MSLDDRLRRNCPHTICSSLNRKRDQHAILTALAGAFGEGTQRAAINAMQAVMTNPRTVLKALELCARLNGELDSAHRMLPVKGPVAQKGVTSGHTSSRCLTSSPVLLSNRAPAQDSFVASVSRCLTSSPVLFPA